ncbi:MAG: pilus assembly protein PilM [Planctomycetota bacterium]
MAGKGIAVDLGSHSLKALSVRLGKHGVKVTGFAATPADEGAGGLRPGGQPLKNVVCGLSGRDMNLRYSQLPPTPDWQLKNLMDLEIQDLSQQSGGSLSADYNLLPQFDPESGVDTVLLALARDEALSRMTGDVQGAGGSIEAFTPNCVALYNAFLKCGPVEEDVVVCLCNIGHETIDLALVKGTDLLFARNLSGGGKVLDDAIAAAFNVSPRKAETLKRDLLDLDPQSRGRFASGQAEKVTMAAGGAANAIVAAIQSSVAFCKAQTKIADLQLDKVLLSGGGARLRGLRGLLREALRCPVDQFDPFANLDLDELGEEEKSDLQQMRYEAVIALGLAVGRADESLYQLEILPAAVKKRRRFAQRTVFNLLAGAVAVLLLVVYAKDRQAETAAAATAKTAAVRQSNQVRSVHDDAQKVIEENVADRTVVQHLAAQAMPLHATLRAMRAVTRNLPPQLWVTQVDVEQKRAAANQPGATVVEVKGSGKELDGANVSNVLIEFSQQLKKDPLLTEVGAVPTLTPGSGVGSRVEFTFTIEFAGEQG